MTVDIDLPDQPKTLPTADEFFGPKADPKLLPTADEFFGRPAQPTTPAGATMSSPELDAYISGTSVGRLLDAFGHGAKQGWGTANIGLSDENAESLKKLGVFGDVQKGQQTILQAFNEGLIRPLAAAADSVTRAGTALFTGAQAATAQIGQELPTGPSIPGTGYLSRSLEAILSPQAALRDIAAYPESRFGSLGEWAPLIERARDVGAVGATEGAYMGTEKVPEGQPPILEAPIARPQVEQPPVPEIPTPKLPSTIDEVARQVDPETFKKFDALADQKAAYMRQLGDMRETQREEAVRQAPFSDEIADLQKRLDEGTTARLAKKYQERLAEMIPQRDDFIEQATTRDSDEMAKVRQDLMAADYQMRDLAPQVGAAYRTAREQVPPEVEPQLPPVEPVSPVEIPRPLETPVETAPKPEIQPETTEPATTTQPRIVPVRDIAADVSQKLVSAGRPQEEADAAAQLIEAHYAARAARFGGEKGTAEELYTAEAPRIRAGRGVRQVEFAQKNELEQKARATITIDNDRATITLMKNADASSFIHETGHQWLEELMRDAADAKAPADLVADGATVRNWLGAGENITRAQHEKFARGFERYMMEGRAPTQALANVFAKFKDWLTTIYKTVAQLRSPITDDIRKVFDRMTAGPEQPVVIGRETEKPPNFADRHEALAESTPPENALTVADQIRAEANAEMAKEPFVNERIAGRNAPEGAEPRGAGPERGTEPTTGGTGEKPGAVGTGGSEPQANGPQLRVEPERKPGKDLAGNIRLENLNTEEDARAEIRWLASQNNDFNDARFGSPAYQLQRQIHASGQLLEKTATEAAEAFSRWNRSNSEADAEAYVKASERVLIAANVRAELAAGTGRGLAAFRKQKVTERLPTEDIVNFIKKSTGKTLFQLKEEGALMGALDTTAQRATFLQDSRTTRYEKIRSSILSYFINNLISGPLTHAAYSVGNTSWAHFKIGADIAATATIDAVKEYMAGAPLEDRVYFSEVPAALFGLYRGFRDSLPAAGRAIKTGIPFMKGAEEMRLRTEGEALPGMEEVPYRNQPLTDYLGKTGYVLETPSRAVSAIHTAFYAANYEAEIARRAVRSAIKDGLTGEDYNTRVAERIASPLDKDVSEAHDEAMKMVLMKKPPFDSFMGGVTRAVNNNIAAKIVMPFLQIGSNILREGLIEHTPIGVVSSEVRANLAGRNGAVAQSTQYAKIAVGTVASVSAIGLAAEGIITGGGPSDPNQRRLKEATGWKPYSVRIGDTYVPFRKYLGPLGPMIAASADMYEIGHAAETEDFSHAAGSLMFGFSEVVADETWFSGLSNFIGAAREYDNPTMVEKYLRGLATDFIPFSVGLSQVSRLVDPYQRQVSSFTDAFKAKVPGLSETLPALNDIWGNPIASSTMLSPGHATNDPVNAALEKLNIAPAPPEHSINGVRLTPQQYADYTRIAGRMAHIRLSAIVNTPGFMSLVDSEPGIATKTIQDTIKSVRETARSMVKLQAMGTENDIVRQATANKQAKLTGAQ